MFASWVNNYDVHQGPEAISSDKDIHLSLGSCGEGKGGRPPFEHVLHFLK
jgi:hypothetical protein